jgi:hypothetical protein
MERIRLDALSVLGGALVGFAAGGAVAFGVSRRYFSRRLDDEIAAAKDHYRARLADLADDGLDPAGEEPAAVGSPEWIARSRAYLAGEGNIGEGEAGSEGLHDDGRDQAPDAGWPPVERDHSKPYVISAEEFSETDIGWQQLTITYYAADKVLVDDKEQPIRDVRNTTGPLTSGDFGGISGDPNIRFVRNERLELDFEIVLDGRSYADVVLNYGNPDRRNR